MSGLEVIGGIASIAQLAATVYSISKTLYEVGDALSNAPSDIQDLARDLETFSEELQLYSALLTGKNGRYGDQIYRLTAKIIGDCATICTKIDRILKKLRSGTVWARVKWLYKEKEILKLLARLKHLKLSLMSTLSVLSALKADYMMDLLGGQNSSLIESSKDEDLSRETLNEVEETRQKLAGVSVAMESYTSNQKSTTRAKCARIGGLDTTLTSQSDLSSTLKILGSKESEAYNTQPDQVHSFNIQQPFMSFVVQNPAAMESVQSFHSAVSFQDEDRDQSPSKPELQRKAVEDQSEVPLDYHAEKRWREEMVATAMRNFSMDYAAAELWANRLEPPVGVTHHAATHLPQVIWGAHGTMEFESTPRFSIDGSNMQLQSSSNSQISSPQHDNGSPALPTSDFKTPLDIRHLRGHQVDQNKPASPPKTCISCNRTETPEWRLGPDETRTLCNACGLHYSKLTRKARIGGKETRPGTCSSLASPTPPFIPRSPPSANMMVALPFNTDDINRYSTAPDDDLIKRPFVDYFKNAQFHDIQPQYLEDVSATSTAMGSSHRLHQKVFAENDSVSDFERAQPEWSVAIAQFTPHEIVNVPQSPRVPQIDASMGLYETSFTPPRMAPPIVPRQLLDQLVQQRQMMQHAAQQQQAQAIVGARTATKQMASNNRVGGRPPQQAPPRFQHFQHQMHTSPLSSEQNSQGQAGGIGPAFVPPQPNLLMSTPKALLRDPPQQPSPPPHSYGDQISRSLGPRFPGTIEKRCRPEDAVSAMLAAMSQEQRRRLSQLPPEKLSEVARKWHTSRQRNAANPQLPTGQMSLAGMQGSPMRQSQPTTTSRLLPPVAPTMQQQHFMMNSFSSEDVMKVPNSSASRPPLALLHAQSLGSTRSNASIAQQNFSQTNVGLSMGQMAQMDELEFPHSLHHFVPGAPDGVKKWSELKQWAQHNPMIPQEIVNRLVRIQYQCYHQIQRPAQLNAVMLSTASDIVPHAGSLEPVAQKPMMTQNGMNTEHGQIWQPTPQDIQNARNHSSGKMANLTDDQIRAIIVRNQQQQREAQQRQNQSMQSMQLMKPQSAAVTSGYNSSQLTACPTLNLGTRFDNDPRRPPRRIPVTSKHRPTDSVNAAGNSRNPTPEKMALRSPSSDPRSCNSEQDNKGYEQHTEFPSYDDVGYYSQVDDLERSSSPRTGDSHTVSPTPNMKTDFESFEKPHRLWFHALFDHLFTDDHTNRPIYEMISEVLKGDSDGLPGKWGTTEALNVAQSFLDGVRSPANKDSHPALASPVNRICDILEVLKSTITFNTGAIPWISICMATKELLIARPDQSLEERIDILNKIAEVSTLVARYNVMESMYQTWDGMTLEHEYAELLIALCAHVLKFLATILSAYKNANLATVSLEHLDRVFSKIVEADKACRGFTVTIDTKDFNRPVDDVSDSDDPDKPASPDTMVEGCRLQSRKRAVGSISDIDSDANASGATIGIEGSARAKRMKPEVA